MSPRLYVVLSNKNVFPSHLNDLQTTVLLLGVEMTSYMCFSPSRASSYIVHWQNFEFANLIPYAIASPLLSIGGYLKSYLFDLYMIIE